MGIGFAISQPAEFTLVPVIAGRERINEMNGYVETARYSGMTVGPLLGGILAGAGGVEVAMGVNAATFVVVALAGLALSARRRIAKGVEATADRARDGIVFLFRERTLATVIAVAFVSLLFMTASTTAEVFFIKEDLAASDAVYGLVFSAWTVGMVLGALLIARRFGPRMLATAALVAVAVQGLGLGLPTVWLVVPFAAAMWFVGGLGHGTKNVLIRTLIQERVPDRLHGRAFAAYNGIRNGAELIALAAGGAMVAAVGGRVTLALAGAIPVAVAIAGLLVYRARGLGRAEQGGQASVAPSPQAPAG